MKKVDEIFSKKKKNLVVTLLHWYARYEPLFSQCPSVAFLERFGPQFLRSSNHEKQYKIFDAFPPDLLKARVKVRCSYLFLVYQYVSTRN